MKTTQLILKKNINSDVGDLKNEELIITLKKDK